MKKKETDSPQVRDLPIPEQSGVRDFVFPSINDPTLTQYGDAKHRFGALAATDPERRSRAQKDSRFVIHPTTREKLFIETEERRVIEERVRSRVEAYQGEVRARAYAEGLEEGKKSGHAAAMAEVKAGARVQLDLVESFLKGAENAKAEILAANEAFIVELVQRIASMIALKEIKADPQYVTRLARGILERIGVRDNITIRVNRAEYESLKLLKDDLEKDLGALKNLNVVASDEIKLGGCKVETDLSAIDASLETQLENVRVALEAAPT